jgi:outer membrane protein insertion porin family
MSEQNALAIRLDPGPLTTIGEIEFEGNVTTRKKIIGRNLAFKKGEPWSLKAIEDSKRQLLRLGLFSRVDIRPRDGVLDSSTEDLIVKVTERPLRTLDIGAGLNSEYGLHLFGEGTDKKIFRDGRSLSLKLDTYFDTTDASNNLSQGIASLRYSDPYFLASAFSLTEDFRFQRFENDTQEFDFDRISLGSYLYRSFWNNTTLSLGHTISQDNLSNVSPDAVLSDLDTGVLDLSFLSGRIDFDQRDNPLNPSSGYDLNLETKLASEAIGSEADFYSVGGRFSFLTPLQIFGPRYELVNSTRMASAWTYGDTPEIPITQRYYVGGRTTVRGFRENSLGPRGDMGSVIGGDILAYNNFELRYRYGDVTQLLTFFDAGNVFLRRLDTDLTDLRTSVGIGVRYISPIGPIGFDVGHPLDEKSGEPSVRLHFNIGNNF